MSISGTSSAGLHQYSRPYINPVASTDKSASPSFSDLLLRGLGEASKIEHKAHSSILDSAEQKDITLTEAIANMQETTIATKLIMQVQLKLVEAWNELRNMQV